MEDISLTTYLIVIAAVGVLVIFNYKKSQKTFRSQKHKRFRESYMEKKNARKDKS